MGTKPAATAMAEWARRARRDAGFTSAEKAAERLGVAASYIRLVESGHIARPGAERLAAMEALYGSSAPTPEEPAPAGAREIIEALDRIALEVRALREVSEGLSDGLGSVLGALRPEAAADLLRRETRSGSDTQ